MPLRLLIACLRHRRALWALTALSLAAMTLAAWHARHHFTSDLALMFPADSLSGTMYQTTQDSRFTQTIQLEITLPEPPPRHTFTAALDTIVQSLANTNQFSRVTARFVDADQNPLGDIIAHLPLIITPDALRDADPTAAVAAFRKNMALPAVPAQLLRDDPFGLRLPLLARLNDFRTLSGLQADTSDGYLISPDGRRALLLITPVFHNGLDASAIRSRFHALETAVAVALPNATTTIISPLQHNLANERAIRHDILAVSLASVAALFLLFLCVYRGAWDAILIPLAPLAATVLVTGLLALCCHRLSLVIIGIGGGIAGLAVDQGIHVYAAWTGPSRIRRLARLALPLSLSVLTSAAVFLLLATTGITAYIQLGIFAAATLVLNLLLSALVLPTLLRKRPLRTFTAADFRPAPRTAGLLAALWLILSLAAFAALPKLRLDLSLRAMDGTPDDIIDQEQTALQRWQTPDAGTMLLVTANSQDDARQACEIITASPLLQQYPLFHPASLWPSRTARARNLAAWQTSETRQLLDDLQQQLRARCASSHLPPALYDRTFTALRQAIDTLTPDTPEPPALQAISRHLFRDCATPAAPGRTAALIFLPRPNLHTTRTLLQHLRTLPYHTALLTSDAFELATRIDLTPRLNRLYYALLPVLLITLAPLLRHPRSLLVIAIPGATAALWGLAIAALCGYRFTIISLFSLVMLAGLVLDYGIFALHIAQSPRGTTSAPTALVLSALTTVLTTGALLASSHPVLFHTGLILSCGIALTALTALFLVPAILTAARRLITRRTAALIAAGAFLCLTTGCQSSLSLPPLLDNTTASPEPHEIARFETDFYKPATRLYTLNTRFLWIDFTVLAVIKTTPDELRAFATAPNGITLFSVAGNARQTTKSQFSDAIPPAARKHLFATFAQDLAHIFLPPLPDEPVASRYGGPPAQLCARRLGDFPRRRWQAIYQNWNPVTCTYDIITYRNFDSHTTFTLKAKSAP